MLGRPMTDQPRLRLAALKGIEPSFTRRQRGALPLSYRAKIIACRISGRDSNPSFLVHQQGVLTYRRPALRHANFHPEGISHPYFLSHSIAP